MGDPALDLLASLVSINTTNDPARGVRPGRDAVDLVKDVLTGWGVEANVLESGGYYSVYGSVGEGEPSVMFMAHLDVVPVKVDEWTHEPFKLTVVGDKAFGRGTVDDKGNVVGVMLALKELMRRKLKGRVLYAFTTDEEVGGVHGAKALAEKLAKENSLPKYLINGDGLGMSPIVRRRKIFKAILEAPQGKVLIAGTLRRRSFELRTPVVPTRHSAWFVPGVDTHPLIAASYFMLSNPEFQAARVDGVFVKTNVLPTTVSIEYVEPSGGGEKVEVDEGLTALLRLLMPLSRAAVPVRLYSDNGVSITPNMYSFRDGKHVVEVDIRAMTEDVNVIKEALVRTASEIAPEVRVDVVDEGGGYLYVPPTDGLVQSAVRVLNNLGLNAYTIEAPGASDSRHFTPLGVKCIDFGPKGGNNHGPDEWVDLNTFRLLHKFYANIALELIGR
ncbi:MAG: M20/M25/M40 family metallo-hydrolase [Zestosphaera sp.]